MEGLETESVHVWYSKIVLATPPTPNPHTSTPTHSHPSTPPHTCIHTLPPPPPPPQTPNTSTQCKLLYVLMHTSSKWASWQMKTPPVQVACYLLGPRHDRRCTHTHTYTHWYEMWPIKLFNYSLIIALILCIVLYPDPCAPLRNVGACMCEGEQDSNLCMIWSIWHAVDWYHIWIDSLVHCWFLRMCSCMRPSIRTGSKLLELQADTLCSPTLHKHSLYRNSISTLSRMFFACVHTTQPLSNALRL